MKPLQRILLASLISAAALFAQAPKAFEWKLPHYTLQVPVSLQGYADAEFAPLVIGKLDQLPKNSEKSRFGVLYRADARDMTGMVVLEIRDAGTNKLIKEVTLEEYYGKESALWSRIPRESKATPTLNRTVFQVNADGQTFLLIREIALKPNTKAPLGQQLTISFLLKSATPMSIKMVFTGKAMGQLTGSAKAVTIASVDTTLKFNPALVLSAMPSATMTVSGDQFKVQGDAVNVKANAETVVMGLVVHATTVNSNIHIGNQAAELRNAFSTGKNSPKIVSVITPDRYTVQVGDTVGYAIQYHNIGTEPAINVKVSNPLPGGTQLLERSMQNDGAAATLVRTTPPPPGKSEVKEIQWNFRNPIPPGEERIVRYRVIFK